MYTPIQTLEDMNTISLCDHLDPKLSFTPLGDMGLETLQGRRDNNNNNNNNNTQ